MARKAMAAENGARAFWDVEEIIGQVAKNDRGEVIQVRRTEKSGRAYVDVRVFYPASDGGLLPGKGIALPADLADEVAGLILQAADQAGQ
ncbi:MAG: transcriptional coactivator p15/PC4 family protein [Firmicutes bacterium]|nr:transcriptional coactivator p15/PC4 family protein [Bacillota bacterium]